MGTRYVGLGHETTYGTPVTATRYEETVADVKPDQGWIIPTPVVSRAFRKKNLGPYLAMGSIGDFGINPEGIVGDLLCGTFGSWLSQQQGGTSAWLHTFAPYDTIEPFTLRLGVEQTERILAGMLVESLSIKMPHDDDIKLSADVLSGFIETKNTIGTPTLSTLQNLHMRDASTVFTIAGSSRKAHLYDCEITIKNNISRKSNYGTRTLATQRLGNREVTGRLSAYFDDTTEYDQFIAGTEFTLIITAVGPTIVGSYKYQLGLELRKCVFLKDAVPAIKPQSDPLVIDAPFKAFYDAGGFNGEARATLQNTITNYNPI
jgi:hypothetical protein